MKANISIEGRWSLTIYDMQGNIVEQCGWQKNQIQDGASTILAQLCAGSLLGSSSPTNGFAYLALGEGDPSWDITPPDKDRTQTTLESEIDRIVITQATDIAYLDPDTELPSVTPTRMCEITVLVDYDRGIGDLREFGIVSGDATSVSNTGVLFNWVSHDVRQKTALSPVQLLLKIRIKFKIFGE